MSADQPLTGKRCLHVWRWRHQYVRGWHCNACCGTFPTAEYPTTRRSRKVAR